MDLEYIAAVLEDYCDLQTSGQISGANRYPVDDVMEQVELITHNKTGVVQRVLMDDVDPNDPTVVIVTNWGAIPFIYEGDADVQQLIEKFNNPLQNDGSWALWSGEELKNCYDVSSRYL